MRTKWCWCKCPRYSVVLTVTVFVLAFTATGFAASASSSYFRFFGPTSIGGVYQCAKDRATVSNDGVKPAIGEVYAYQGTSCTTAFNRPAGYLGTKEYLIKGTSGSGGTVCGFRDWQYNPGTGYAYSVPAPWTGPNGTCPSGAAYYAQAKGAYWRTDTGSYVVPSSYRNSPNLNF